MRMLPSLPVLAVVAIALTGCGTTSVVKCPNYPYPNLRVLSLVGSLQSGPVDDWMIDQAQLAQKLELCN